jgi:hypothetical protein
VRAILLLYSRSSALAWLSYNPWCGQTTMRMAHSSASLFLAVHRCFCRLPAAAGPKGNWEAFWAAVHKDHSNAALIWNEGTRAELREALQARAAFPATAYSPQPSFCLLSCLCLPLGFVHAV